MSVPNPAHTAIERVHVGGIFACCSAAFAEKDLGLNRAHYCFRDLVLQFKEVAGGSVVRLSPEVRASFRVDQLCRDPNALSKSTDAALKHMADAKLPANLPHIDGFPLILKGGITRDHEQVSELG